MRDGVLVPHITPRREPLAVESATRLIVFRDTFVVAPSVALVAPSLPVCLRRGTRLSR